MIGCIFNTFSTGIQFPVHSQMKQHCTDGDSCDRQTLVQKYIQCIFKIVLWCLLHLMRCFWKHEKEKNLYRVYFGLWRQNKALDRHSKAAFSTALCDPGRCIKVWLMEWWSGRRGTDRLLKASFSSILSLTQRKPPYKITYSLWSTSWSEFFINMVVITSCKSWHFNPISI